MINEIKQDAISRMQKAVEALQVNLGKIRTGRAHPSLLTQVKVDYYGNPTPLDQVASINVADPRTILVTPWDKTMCPAIEKAILTSDLGLNPATMGESVRVPMPALTEERRRDLIKVVRKEAETSRVSVRNVRRDANEQLKNALKDKLISEDEEHRGQDLIQQATDDAIKHVDEHLAKKEQDLMEV